MNKNEQQWLVKGNKGGAQRSIMGPHSYHIFSNDMPFLIDDDMQICNYADGNNSVCTG